MMPMPDQWMIEIWAKPGGGVYFLPDVIGAKEGDPLHAKPSDLVFWANRTDADIRLNADPQAQFPQLIEPIRAGENTSLFKVPDGVPAINYACANPPQRHTIQIGPALQA
jgi:hypothetical protein